MKMLLLNDCNLEWNEILIKFLKTIWHAYQMWFKSIMFCVISLGGNTFPRNSFLIVGGLVDF